MADWIYKVVVAFGRFPFWATSRPVVLHAERVPRSGAFILASNHLSPYDVPVLMRHAGRMLDFVSIVEVFENPVVAALYGSLNAFPLDRGRVDVGTTKTVVDRLRRGRVVAMFPEGRIRRAEESVVAGAPFKPGVVRMARMAGVPVVPVVVWGTGRYGRAASWVPGAGVRYGVNFGEAIDVGEEGEAVERLGRAWRELFEELRGAGGVD